MKPPRSRRLGAGVIFGAVTILFGIVTHLTAEFVGLGWRADASIVLSGRHAYLGVMAIGSIVAALVAVLSTAPSGSRARAVSLIDALPFRGRGAGFTAAAFIAQFAFFVASQMSEGCPIRSGDVIAAVLAAAITAALGALVVALGKRRLLEFVLALVWAVRPAASPQIRNGLAPYAGPSAPAPRCTPFSFRYRPPPQAA